MPFIRISTLVPRVWVSFCFVLTMPCLVIDGPMMIGTWITFSQSVPLLWNSFNPFWWNSHSPSDSLSIFGTTIKFVNLALRSAYQLTLFEFDWKEKPRRLRSTHLWSSLFYSHSASSNSNKSIWFSTFNRLIWGFSLSGVILFESLM